MRCPTHVQPGNQGWLRLHRLCRPKAPRLPGHQESHQAVSYTQAFCPSCARPVEVSLRPGDALARFAIHTPLDGTGRLCLLVGQPVKESTS